jgi:hypothetical protein
MQIVVHIRWRDLLVLMYLRDEEHLPPGIVDDVELESTYIGFQNADKPTARTELGWNGVQY